jgi:hypothetical protein
MVIREEIHGPAGPGPDSPKLTAVVNFGAAKLG